MIIKEANKGKIETMIKEAEGRATARTITYRDIVDALQRIEENLGIAKKNMIGVRASVDVNAQNFPRAYKYRAESTWFYAVRKSSGWNLTDVDRDWTAREGHGVRLYLTDKAKEALIARHTEF